MKKISLSLGIILIVLAVVITSGTVAFLSDEEKSIGNTFTAGAIDLKVDNESYYNGAISQSTTFGPSDLSEGMLFINFRDLKPDDEGEDTISLHVNTNDAWLCMDMSLTTNDDISSNEPELGAGDAPDIADNSWDGELGDLTKMIWWVDDGDNVLEEGEALLNGGVKSVTEFFGTDNLFTADLADATTNVWTNQPGPALGNQDYYLAKAWCFGTMAEARITQDGFGKLPGSTNGPLVRGSGITCNGTALGNESQTDGVTMDIAFRAVQARHNTSFTCGEEVRQASITVTKNVTNNNGGNNSVSSFLLYVGDTPVTSGVAVNMNTGTYDVSETGAQGYQASYGGDCNLNGTITLVDGGTYNCTVTNDDIGPNITLIKNVINDNTGAAVANNFKMRVDGFLVPNGSSRTVDANTDVTITEDAFAGYTATGISGAGCPASLGTPFQLNEGVAITCTITNDDNP